MQNNSSYDNIVDEIQRSFDNDGTIVQRSKISEAEWRERKKDKKVLLPGLILALLIVAVFAVAIVVIARLTGSSKEVGLSVVYAAEMGRDETTSIEVIAVSADEAIERWLRNLGCTNIHVSQRLAVFEINGYSGQLYAYSNGRHRSDLFFSEDGEQFIPAIREYDADDKLVYDAYSNGSGFSLSVEQIRCLDYVAFNGEFFQNGDGTYFSVAEDVRIWTLGEEPESYDYD